MLATSSLVHGSNLVSASQDVQGFRMDLSTYFGGSGNDEPRHVATDAEGNIIILGQTTSQDFPLVEAYQTQYASGGDLVLVKISSSWDAVVFSTFLGGSNEEYASGIGIDSDGNIVITGVTASTDFPVLNAVQPDHAGGVFDAYIAKFSPIGDLIFSTFLGGTDRDWAYGVAFDDSDNIIFTGHMTSDDYPTLDPLRPFSGGEEAVVTKLSSDGQTIQFSTYFGGSGDDFGIDIAVDSDGNIVVAGLTLSEDLPTLGAHQESFGGDIDGFIAKISADGQNLLFSTYLGGTGQDGFWGVSVDSSDSIVASGRAGSADFPVSQQFNDTHGGREDGSLVKFSSTGELMFSRCIGGSSNDLAWDVAILTNDTYAIVGETRSSDFETVVPIQENLTRHQDAFVAVANEFGTLLFSSYIGGESNDMGYSCVGSSVGGFIMTGKTASDDMVIIDPIQENRSDSYDFLLIEFSPLTPAPAIQEPDILPLVIGGGAGAILIVVILLILRRRR
jgi:hypothetical protein